VTHRLGVYFAPHHDWPATWDYLARLQPPAVRVLAPGVQDGSVLRRVHATAPGALLLPRNWQRSEQHDAVWAEPVQTGYRHAREWRAEVDGYGLPAAARVVVVGINEPKVWEGIAPYVAYTVAFLDECARLGLVACALNLSVGWPANKGAETPPDWSAYAPVEEAIRRGGHYLCVHEYWDERGPGFNWGWWAGRVASCPWDVPIIIGECGIDKGVTAGGMAPGQRGWQALGVTPDVYAGQLVEYTNRCDRRVVAVLPFLTDYQAGEWASFDTHPAHGALLARMGDLKEPAPPLPPVPAPPPPGPLMLAAPVEGGIVSQWYGERPDAYAGFGLRGHNGIDYAVPVGTPVRAVADGTVAMTGVDPAYGVYVRLWHKQLRCHTFYAHLDAVLVAIGEQVTQGQVIARSGNTGNSTGPHLHFEVRVADADGNYERIARMGKGAVDPVSFRLGLERGALLAGGRVWLPLVSGASRELVS
jgi:murein DD-endopeptidase MepM/ murein hydrolase activator NlpD